MSCSRDDERESRDLWQRFADATGRAAQEDEVDPNALAAYVDGTAHPEEAEVVEHAMAADSSLVDAIAELREVLASEPADVPESRLHRIKAALSGLAGNAGMRPASPGRISFTPWYVGVAAAAAILIASFAGFEVGRYGVGNGGARGTAISRELAPELDDAGFEGGLLAAFERAEDRNGGAR